MNPQPAKHLTTEIETREKSMLYSCNLDTPLGTMLAIADHEVLYSLEFADCLGLESKKEKLCLAANFSAIVPGRTMPHILIQSELQAYFRGDLREFQTPVYLSGTRFQRLAWEALRRIPYGELRSYADQAVAIGQPSAFRAVAHANSRNHFAIIVPCHRVINSNGKLGGYSSGLERKQWLIKHENCHS